MFFGDYRNRGKNFYAFKPLCPGARFNISLDMWDLVFIFLIGVAVSGFGTVVGFGGGVFMVPILTLVFQIPIRLAIGCVILALLPSALISTIHNGRRGLVDFVAGTLLEIPTMLGTVLGALATSYLPTRQLEFLFGVVIILAGYMMLRQHGNIDIHESPPSFFAKLNNLPPRIVRHGRHGTFQMSVLAVAGSGLLSGSVAGLFGIGGGFLKTPIMVVLFKIPPRIAVATALFMIVITSLTGSITHYMLGHIQWRIGITIVASFVVGALGGNMLGTKVSDKRLSNLIAYGLMAAGIAMFVGTFFQ
jgi:uncharacterized membrane protein YfcA